MKKTVCDLCGTDCQETGFLIPDYNTYHATNCDGTKLATLDRIEKTQMDLCPACTRRVAALMQYLRRHCEESTVLYMMENDIYIWQ